MTNKPKTWDEKASLGVRLKDIIEKHKKAIQSLMMEIPYELGKETFIDDQATTDILKAIKESKE